MPDFSRYNHDRTEKWCKGCGFTLLVSQFRTRTKKTGAGAGRYLNNECKRCEAGNVARYRKTTEEGVAAEIHRRLKARAKRNGLPFDLTIEWILQKLRGQQYRCKLTGFPMACEFTPAGRATAGFRWNAISADRYIGADGYTKANTRFVLNVVNLFKNDGDDERMYQIAAALLEGRK